MRCGLRAGWPLRSGATAAAYRRPRSRIASRIARRAAGLPAAGPPAAAAAPPPGPAPASRRPCTKSGVLAAGARLESPASREGCIPRHALFTASLWSTLGRAVAASVRLVHDMSPPDAEHAVEGRGAVPGGGLRVQRVLQRLTCHGFKHGCASARPSSGRRPGPDRWDSTKLGMRGGLPSAELTATQTVAEWTLALCSRERTPLPPEESQVSADPRH